MASEREIAFARYWEGKEGREITVDVVRNAYFAGWGDKPSTALYSAADMQALREENERLRACVDFTLSDASRLLQKSDVLDVCPHPDECFYEIERARCGPCAVKASAAEGIIVDDTHSHLPEVCKLRREVKAAEARAQAAEQRVKEAVRLLILTRPEGEGWTVIPGSNADDIERFIKEAGE